MSNPQLSDAERMTLARAIQARTGFPAPKGEYDLSGVLNEVERVVGDMLADEHEVAFMAGYDQAREDLAEHECETHECEAQAKVARVGALADEWARNARAAREHGQPAAMTSAMHVARSLRAALGGDA